MKKFLKEMLSVLLNTFIAILDVIIKGEMVIWGTAAIFSYWMQWYIATCIFVGFHLIAVHNLQKKVNRISGFVFEIVKELKNPGQEAAIRGNLPIGSENFRWPLEGIEECERDYLDLEIAHQKRRQS